MTSVVTTGRLVPCLTNALECATDEQLQDLCDALPCTGGGGGGITQVEHNNTYSINITGAGTNASKLQATTNISPADGNTLSVTPQGLFVPAVDTAINHTDSGTVELVGDGSALNPLRATAVVSQQQGNSLVAETDGLFVPAAATNVTHANTQTVNLLGAGTTDSPLTASANISTAADNVLQSDATGLYVPAATGGSGLTTVAHTDTYSIAMTGGGTDAQPLQATTRISTAAGNQLTVGPSGLFVAASAGGITEVTHNDSNTANLTGAGTTESPLVAAARVSATAGNQITANNDGLFVPAATFNVATANSPSVNLAGNGNTGSPVTATVNVSATAGNIATINSDGIFVPTPPASIASVSHSDTSTVTLAGAGTTNSPLSAVARVSGDANNAIEARDDGLFAGAVQAGQGLTEVDLTQSAAKRISLSNETLTSLRNADTAVQPNDISDVVRNMRSITGSDGLAGGGDLSADRSITLTTENQNSLSQFRDNGFPNYDDSKTYGQGAYVRYVTGNGSRVYRSNVADNTDAPTVTASWTPIGALAFRDSVNTTDLNATGTADNTTYLRGDSTWQKVFPAVAAAYSGNFPTATASSGGNTTYAIGYGANSGALGTIAFGYNARSSTTYGIAIGYGASATNSNTVVLGPNASASAGGSIAIGNDSVASEGYECSFGNTTIKRRLTNIAAAQDANDAVTLGQFQQMSPPVVVVSESKQFASGESQGYTFDNLQLSITQNSGNDLFTVSVRPLTGSRQYQVSAKQLWNDNNLTNYNYAGNGVNEIANNISYGNRQSNLLKLDVWDLEGGGIYLARVFTNKPSRWVRITIIRLEQGAGIPQDLIQNDYTPPNYASLGVSEPPCGCQDGTIDGNEA